MALYNIYSDNIDEASYEKAGAPSRVPGLQSQFAAYIKSPTYKKRLEKQGVKNPDKVINQRLQKLDQVDLSVGPSASLMYLFNKPNQKEQVPGLTVKQKDSDYTMMHEISHVTNYGDYFFDPKKNKTVAKDDPNVGDANTASGKGMSLNEMLYLTDRTTLPSKFKNDLRERGTNMAKWGSYKNPADGMPGDTHSFDPSELKSDLDSLRLLFKREGVTKKFGEDISEETINKALKNPKIANEPHFMRMLKNFSKKNIVDVNNNIAMNGLAQSTMA